MLRDLQKKANKQAGVLPGKCRLYLWHWAQSRTLCLLYTSTPKTREEREHRRKPRLCSRHILRCKSRDLCPHLSQCSRWLHGNGALTPRCHGRKLPVRTQDVIHLAYGVSGTDARCVWSACVRLADVRKSKFSVEINQINQMGVICERSAAERQMSSPFIWKASVRHGEESRRWERTSKFKHPEEKGLSANHARVGHCCKTLMSPRGPWLRSRLVQHPAKYRQQPDISRSVFRMMSSARNQSEVPAKNKIKTIIFDQKLFS